MTEGGWSLNRRRLRGPFLSGLIDETEIFRLIRAWPSLEILWPTSLEKSSSTSSQPKKFGIELRGPSER